MQLSLRVGLIIGALLMLAFVLNKIRRKQLGPNDAVFWFIFAGVLVVVAIFPDFVIVLSELVGFYSPVNLVFLIVLTVVILRLLMISVENARLKAKLNEVAQTMAIEKEQKISKKSN